MLLVEDYFSTLSPERLRKQATDGLESETGDIRVVLEFAALIHPRVTVSPDLRELGHEFYRPLVQHWKGRNPGIRTTLLPGLQAFILLDTRQPDPDVDPEGERRPDLPRQGSRPIDRFKARKRLRARLLARRHSAKAAASKPSTDTVTINLLPLTDPGFDWSEGQRILLQIDAIGESARLWIHDPEERRPHLERVYGLAFQLLKAVEMESFRRASGSAGDDKGYASTLDILKSEAEKASQEFRGSAEQSAQRMYARGMFRGGLFLLMLSVILGAAFLGFAVPAVAGIALPAGGIGAAISVFQRMHLGSSVVDFHTAADRLRMFGSLRPIIGGVFGMFVFALIESGLIGSTLTVPPSTGKGLAYVGVVGFLAGFNERFAQDVITTSSARVGGAIAAAG